MGGTWLSLAAVHAGSAFLWASIFLSSAQGLLQGIAYALWGLSMLPILWQLGVIMRSGVTHDGEKNEKIAGEPQLAE